MDLSGWATVADAESLIVLQWGVAKGVAAVKTAAGRAEITFVMSDATLSPFMPVASF